MLAKFLAVIAFACLITACGTIEKLSSVNVPVKQIVIAANSVDAAETAATGYVRYCTPNPAPAGCSDSLIRGKIVPAVQAVRTARNAAEQFVIDNPDATLGPATLVSAVTTAVSALQTILSENHIK